MEHRRRRLLPILLPLALGASACAGTAASPSSEPSATSSAIPSFPAEVLDAAALTDYDATAPLDTREESPAESVDGVTVHDVTWASPRGGRVSAWVVVPAGAGPFAGLVYLHGSETSRYDFLDEAIAMAQGGAVSVVLDAPFARLGDGRRYALEAYEEPEEERAMTAQAIVDVRRAYDLLVARGDVDAERMGFIGHSWGASLGLVTAALDDRPGSLVLITGRPSWTGFLASSEDDWVVRARERTGPRGWQRYLSLMAPLDAMAVIEGVEGSRLYLQYGTRDDVVPEGVARELIDAAHGATVDLYPAGHALNNQATADRVGWLVERLALEPIGPEVLEEVGLPDR